jgi:hypothetical protein
MTILPQSTALAEADTNSLAELFSRDPEGFSELDRRKLVQALRAQRERWLLAEAGKGPRPKTGKALAQALKPTETLEELGL